MNHRLAKLARPWAVALLLLALLQGAKTAGVLPMTIPAPSDVLAALRADHAMLLANGLATCEAAALGFLIALAASLALMALVAYVPAAQSVVYNTALVLHTLPLLVLAPILVIWFGLGIETRVIIAALASYYAILIGGLHGLKAGTGRAAELMHLLSASRTQMLLKVTLPYAMPALFAGLKVGATGAVLGAVIAEWTGADSGLGVMMSYALFSFQVPRVWLTMFTMMLLAVAVYALVQLAERRVLRWSPLGRAGH